MKKMAVIVALIFGITLLGNPSAHAIFGLSACEKVKKSLLHEESIGLLYFNDFARQRKLLLKMPSPMRKNMSDVFSLLSNVYASDQKVYAIVENNTKCFTAKQVIDARKASYRTEQDASTASWVTMFYQTREQNEPLGSKDIKLVRETYTDFYSFLNPRKKLA